MNGVSQLEGYQFGMAPHCNTMTEIFVALCHLVCSKSAPHGIAKDLSFQPGSPYRPSQLPCACAVHNPCQPDTQTHPRVCHMHLLCRSDIRSCQAPKVNPDTMHIGHRTIVVEREEVTAGNPVAIARTKLKYYTPQPLPVTSLCGTRCYHHPRLITLHPMTGHDSSRHKKCKLDVKMYTSP